MHLAQVPSLSFWSYWDRIKSKIAELRALPGKLRMLKLEIGPLSARAARLGEPGLVGALTATGQRLDSITVEADKVQDKINRYLPEWQSAAGKGEGLGALPVVLGVAALGAAAYVATKGLSLLKNYAQEKAILDDAKRKVISLEQAKGLISAVKETGRPLVAAQLGLGSLLIPIALIGGALVFFGMRR